MQELCLQTVAANFTVSPSLAYLPEAHLSKLISLLSLELPLELAGSVSLCVYFVGSCWIELSGVKLVRQLLRDAVLVFHRS